MSRRGNCHDNAVAESFFQLLKRERIKKKIYGTREEARSDIFDYIEMFYNSKRRHGSSDQMSPTEYENQYYQRLGSVQIICGYSYHARTRISDERTGDTYDYSRRTDLYGHFILAPVNAPEHIVKDSTALWNEVERVERQSNGQTARYFDVAIPAELNNEDKKKLVLEYCQKNYR